MSIYKENAGINKICVGSQRYVQVYKGGDLYWEAPKSYSDIEMSVEYAYGNNSPIVNINQSWGWYENTSGGGGNSSATTIWSGSDVSVDSSTGEITSWPYSSSGQITVVATLNGVSCTRYLLVLTQRYYSGLIVDYVARSINSSSGSSTVVTVKREDGTALSSSNPISYSIGWKIKNSNAFNVSISYSSGIAYITISSTAANTSGSAMGYGYVITNGSYKANFSVTQQP